MPVELDPLLAQAEVATTVVAGAHTFYVGSLEANEVILALSGIGTINATQTTKTALAKFRCGSQPGISGIVFSGTSGGDYIGDVFVPSRWTKDDGKSWIATDPAMLATARGIARTVKLEQTNPVGDPACTGQPPDLVPTVSVQHAPTVAIGGDGQTADPFGGRRLPCIPYGGDVFGCAPCRGPSDQSSEAPRFLTGAAPFVDPRFFTGYFSAPPSSNSKYVAQDMETGAVGAVAAQHGVPFIGFRAASDGKGDPLMLPGFPFQFFVYRQLAADNAALTALAFLKAWATR
jgi:nucleoside phosphorylase